MHEDVARAFAFMRKGDIAAAETSFQRAVAADPKSLDAHLTLGRFYVAKRDIAKATEEFKAAGDMAPVGSPAKVLLAGTFPGACAGRFVDPDVNMVGNILASFAVVNLLLVIFGLVAFGKLPLRGYPDIDPPSIVPH